MISKSSKEGRKLKLFEITLFNVCCILSLDTIGAGASMGVQGMSWRILGILFFLIPYGLISAELGSTWPRTGGIYIWTKLAFGDFWATMVSWLYWINVVYWIPSIFVTFAAIFTSAFFPELSETITPYLQASLGTLLIWLIVFLGIRNITLSDFVTSIGAIIKAVLFSVLGFLGIIYGLKHKLANSFSLPKWMITWDATIAFAPLIVYNFAGFEVVSSFSDKLREPRKDIPRAVMIAGLLISFLYVFSAFGVLAVFRVEEINIVTSVSDSFKILVLKTLGDGFYWLFFVLIIFFLLALFAFVFGWAFGSNYVISETGLDKKLKLLGHRHPRYESPDHAFYLTGVIGTALLLGNFIGMRNIQQIFWTIFALSSILLLLPYLFMFPAGVKLRRIFPEIPRPYRIPGGKLGLWLSAILGELLLFLACIFFFIPPKNTENVLRYELSLVLGIFLTLVLGVVIHLKSKKRISQKIT